MNWLREDLECPRYFAGTGDAMSNMMMAWVAGDVNPTQMIRRMREVRNLDPESGLAQVLESRVRNHGLAFEDRTWLDLMDPETDRMKLLRRPRQFGFRINDTINKIERHAYTLEKLQRVLTPEEIASLTPELVNSSPRLRAAIDGVARDAADVLGSFDDLSPFERKYLKVAVPFYPWIRHVTKLVKNL